MISSRAGSMPPMTSTTTSMSGSLTTSKVSRVSTPGPSSTSRSRDRLRTATRAISSCTPVRASISFAWRGDEADEGGADVAAPEDADRGPVLTVVTAREATARRRSPPSALTGTPQLAGSSGSGMASPKLMPMSRAVRIVSQSSGTFFSRLVASAIGT